MRNKIVILFFLLISLKGNSQNDTINQLDENNLKQGYWIYYAKNLPDSVYTEKRIIEEGRYLDGRKNGQWTKYYSDGKTIKLKGYYKNNRPNGYFETYYANGNLKKTGCFPRGDTLYDNCQEYWYYESGELEKYRMNDSIVSFFKSGCLKSIETFNHSNLGMSIIILYDKDSCNLKKDTAYNYRNHYKSVVVEKSDCSFKSGDTLITVNIDEIDDFYNIPPPIKLKGSFKKLFKPNGYNKVFNDNDELWQDGIFKNGSLWNGKVYFFDSDGILIRVLIYKNGRYYSDGKL